MIIEKDYKESPSSAEVEAFLKETKKVPYGEVLSSVFQDYTVAKTRELNGNKLIGRVGKKETGPLMVLTNFSAIKEARLAIFSKRKDIDFISGDFTFHAKKIRLSPQNMPTSNIVISFKSGTKVLSEYTWLLVEVADKIHFKLAGTRLTRDF